MNPFLLFMLIWVPTSAIAIVIEYFGNYKTLSMTTACVTVLITWAAAMGIVCYIRFKQMKPGNDKDNSDKSQDRKDSR